MTDGTASSRTVPILVDPSPRAFYEDYVRRGRPAILRGVVSEWPAFARWRPEMFAERYGKTTVPLEQQDRDAKANPIERFKTRRFYETDMTTFISTLAQDRGLYLSQWNAFNALPELRADVRSLDAYMSAGVPPAVAVNLWLGPSATVSTLHFDDQDNLFAQVWGEKEFLLFEPKQAHLLYSPWYEGCLFNFSPVDVHTPDLARYPRFAQARGTKVIVNAGEILYIPSRWWHAVSSRTLSLSLSHMWVDRKARMFVHNLEASLKEFVLVKLLRRKSWRRATQRVLPLSEAR